MKRKSPQRIKDVADRLKIHAEYKSGKFRAVIIAERWGISTSALYRLIRDVDDELAAAALKPPPDQLPLVAPVEVEAHRAAVMAELRETNTLLRESNALQREQLELLRSCWGSK